MPSSPDPVPSLGDATRRIAQHLLVIVENRLHLLLVEAQEERERALLAILLALCSVAFGLLAGITMTVVIAIAFWAHSPVIALLVLVLLYTVAAVVAYLRLIRLQREWQTLPETLEQLRKDSECLKKTFI